MAKPGPAAVMRKHAKAAAEMLLAEYGHVMDYSEPTIGAVESVLNGLWRDGNNSKELMATFSILFGAYIGEMIRNCFPEAKWMRSASSPGGADTPFIQVEDIKLFPVSWCYKRLHNGPDDSVVAKYLAFRDVMDMHGVNRQIPQVIGRPTQRQ